LAAVLIVCAFALNLNLRAYHRDDVARFCALPEMKAKKYAGFTRKAKSDRRED
jgi:hypothetical protein